LNRKALTILFVCIPVLLQAQEHEIILSEDFRGSFFNEFVKDIESEYGVQFYYQENWVDSVKVYYPSGVNNLLEILQYTFRNTDFSVASIGEGDYILSKEYLLETRLLPDFFTIPESLFKKDVEQTIKDTDETVSDGQNGVDENGNSSQIIYIGSTSQGRMRGEATLSGYIRESETGEPIIGAVIYVEDLELGVISDLSGYYVLSLPKGRHFINYHSLGKKDIRHQVVLNADGNLNIELTEKITQLRGVEVVADKAKDYFDSVLSEYELGRVE